MTTRAASLSVLALSLAACGGTQPAAPDLSTTAPPDLTVSGPRPDLTLPPPAPDLVAPTCTDGARNQDESDVDCGGGCAACADGRLCARAADCASGACAGGRCAPPSCTDGAKNGGEADIDCGGPCSGCADGSTCGRSTDCASGTCTAGRCVAGSCTDGIKNGSETDIDCGGSCSVCNDGSACGRGGDCASGICVGARCVAPGCTDGVKNGGETDVDCGGATCSTCADGRACARAGDCASAVCTGGRCAAPDCTDGIKNGGESDVDCGGAGCGRCSDGKVCGRAADCQSAVCGGGRCAAPTCGDGAKNGDETDADCGGATCSACGDTRACGRANDCTSGVCTAGRCAAAACPDGVKNGRETDVDCGGGAGCPACAEGKACAAVTDCASGGCLGGRCASPTSCASLHAALPALTDGPYMIDPDGAGGDAPFTVYCDMTTAGGGWTLVAKATGNSTGTLNGDDLERWINRGVVGDTSNLNPEEAIGRAYSTVSMTTVLIRSLSTPARHLAWQHPVQFTSLWHEVSKRSVRSDGALLAGGVANLDWRSGCGGPNLPIAGGSYQYGLVLPDSHNVYTTTFLGMSIGSWSGSVVGWRGVANQCSDHNSGGGFGFKSNSGNAFALNRHICGYGSGCTGASWPPGAPSLNPHGLFVR